MPGPRLILLHLVNPVASARQPCSSVSSRNADAAVADAATPAPSAAAASPATAWLPRSREAVCLGARFSVPPLVSFLPSSPNAPSLGVFPIPQTSHGAADCTLTPLGLEGAQTSCPKACRIFAALKA
ncbi:hypothetical protein GQ607_012912 [Colletotrichum asianum]|uniref:Secreted protein n=1 Tax=Colletotrichum asianum TaxID=702518 RepID=A0A8H3ZQ93_9PEZI|nr:hypothetical protein GQ607_012912 [Colletotrichum asianum]